MLATGDSSGRSRKNAGTFGFGVHGSEGRALPVILAGGWRGWRVKSLK